MCYKILKWANEQENEVKPLQTSPEGYLYFMDQMLLEKLEDEENQISWKNQVREVLKQLQGIYAYSASENAEYSYLDETRLFNEGKLAVYVNGVWGASMISENINARYALLPTFPRMRFPANQHALAMCWEIAKMSRRRMPLSIF